MPQPFQLKLVLRKLIKFTLFPLAVPVMAVSITALAGDTSPVELTMDTNVPGTPIPPDFSGFSFETGSLLSHNHFKANGYFFDPTNTELLTLFKNLGIKGLRIGGDSMDRGATPSTNDLDAFFAFVKAANLKVIYSVRLANGDPSQDASLAKYVWDHYRPYLISLAIGNEANSYNGLDRKIKNSATYIAKWNKFASAVIASTPGVVLGGPDNGNGSTSWALDFANAEQGNTNVAFVFSHYEPGGPGRGKTPQRLIDEMLSPICDTQKYPAFCKVMTDMTQPLGWSYRFTEDNTQVAPPLMRRVLRIPRQRGEAIIHTSPNATSNHSFATALFALDFMHWWAAHGCQGIHFHTGFGGFNGGLFLDKKGYYEIYPLYYGIATFDVGGQGTADSLAIKNPNDLNLTAYAVTDTNDNLFVTIINKEHGKGARDATVKINAPGGQVSVMYLKSSANNITATSGITLGGAKIDGRTPWQGEWTPLDFTNGAGCEVAVKASSAAIVKFANAGTMVLQAGQSDTPSHPKTSSQAVRVKTDYIDANISLDYPGFAGLSLDSLGKEDFPMVVVQPPAKPWHPTEAIQVGSRVEYRRPGADSSEPPRWAIELGTDEITLESHWSADDPPEPLVFAARNNVCRVTMLGLMETNGTVNLPAVLYFPGQGAFQISNVSGGIKSVDYETPLPSDYPKRRRPNTVQITFPGATKENPTVTYCWKVAAIHPPISGIDSDPRFDAFRRDWLNILQLSPQWQALANNAASTTCAFCYYEYADIAAQTPPLASGLSALDMVRQTLDRIIAGGSAYGMQSSNYASDTLPSMLIAAEDYVQGTKDTDWLAQNYDELKSWTDKMLATDTGGDGLIKYYLSGDSGSWPEKAKYHPSNWWDTIGFGHEDAYANALAYHALLGMEQLAQQTGHSDDQARYHAAADKLKAAYFKTFYDPATGVLAGWRSADGQLHDYYFLWVNGIAIHYGLVPRDKANDIMNRLLAKMRDVGYTNFSLGLPGNLIPVARKDYVDLRLRVGGGVKADNSDGFQIYENGGATACFAYFTLVALYDLGRVQDGDQILFPILASIADGGFEGFSDNGRSKDWKAWDGMGHGYEGFLSDNYYVLLVVLDRKAALEARIHQFQPSSGSTEQTP